MALAIHASTPALAGSGNDPWTSASFTPPVDSLLVVCAGGDWFGESSEPVFTVSTNLGDLTFTSRVSTAAENSGKVQIWTAPVGANGGVARTVSVATDENNDDGAMKVFVITGADNANPSQSTDTDTSSTNNMTMNVLNSLTGWVVGIGVDWQSLGAPTSTDVEDSFDNANISVTAVRKAAVSVISTETLNFDAGGSGTPTWRCAAIAVRAGASGTDLVIAQATHAHTVDNVVLTQVHDLVVQDATHAHTVDNVALTQVVNLVIADALHAHTADNLTLTTETTLAVADTQHAHTADNLALTQDHDLTVADATHAHAVDSPTLTQVHTLVIAEAIHSHTVDNLTLSTEASLSINDAVHSHTVDSLSLTQAHNLTVQETEHDHAADNVVLSIEGELEVADAVHAHSADNVALEQVHVLSIDQATHAHTADNVVLEAGAINLVIADALHSLSSDSLTLTVTYNLTVADATHGHTADGLTLTQTHVLVIAEAHHQHLADNVEIAGAIFRFEPPTHEEPIRTDTKPLSYYRLTWAGTVLRSGDTFIQRRTPAPHLLEAAGEEGTDWFRGGCVYTVTEDVADELTAAGYSVTPL